MDHAVIKSLLDSTFYSACKDYLRADLFEAETAKAFAIISALRDEDAEVLITPDDLRRVFRAENADATRAARELFDGYVDLVERAEPVPSVTARRILKRLYARRTGQIIADYALQLADGEYDRVADIRSVLERADALGPDVAVEAVSKEVEDLLDMTGDDSRFAFCVPSIKRAVYGIGRGEFGVIFATPETGKTAFSVTLACAPGGYCDQGARVLYLGNEEDPARTMLRAYSCYTGMTRAEIVDNLITAKQAFAKIRDRIDMFPVQGWSIEQAEALIKQREPDVVIIDQADKLAVAGDYNAGHERIRALYISLREMAKRCRVALWGVSQASDLASGRTRLDLNMMEGSRIGKAAEVDIAIGIGKMAGEDDSQDRYVTLAKNKISGVHETIVCQIRHKISRYEG